MKDNTESQLLTMLNKTINPGKVRESLIDSCKLRISRISLIFIDFVYILCNVFSVELSDVIFILGHDKQQLRAIKSFLITSSPILYQVLINTTAEVETILTIPNIDKPTMVEVCRYAYSENVKFTTDNMFDILQAAKHLDMKFLVEKSIDFISRDGLNEKTVLTAIEVSKKLNNTKLAIRCFDFIKKNHQKFLNSQEFTKISKETLQLLIENCELPFKAAKGAVQTWALLSMKSMMEVEELMALVALNCVDDSWVIVQDSEPNANSVVTPPKTMHVTTNVSNTKTIENRQPQQKSAENAVKTSINANAPQILNIEKLKRKLMDMQNQLKIECQTSPVKVNFVISGELEFKQSTYSNLDFDTSTRIMINEICFVYDLRQTDKEFHLQIFDVTQKHQKKSLFSQTVQTHSSAKGGFVRYKLPRPCLIDGPKNMWISIEFGSTGTRASLSKIECESNKNVTLRGHNGPSRNAQVVSNIIYSLY